MLSNTVQSVIRNSFPITRIIFILIFFTTKGVGNSSTWNMYMYKYMYPTIHLATKDGVEQFQHLIQCFFLSKKNLIFAGVQNSDFANHCDSESYSDLNRMFKQITSFL